MVPDNTLPLKGQVIPLPLTNGGQGIGTGKELRPLTSEGQGAREGLHVIGAKKQ